MHRCPPFWHFGTVRTCQIKLTRKFRDVSAQTTACGRNDLFFALHLILGGKLVIYSKRMSKNLILGKL